MKQIRFKKDGSQMIKLGDQWYRPLTLEKILVLESAFYAGTALNDQGDMLDDLENPISEWFNYKGFTYVAV